MKSTFSKLVVVLTIAGQVFGPAAIAADISYAHFNVSANVPVVFSVTARGIPGDLDLTPDVVVEDRLIGILHFKYNKNVASLEIASSTASGEPEQAGTAYDFEGGGFQVSIGAGCQSVDATYNTAFSLTNAGTDIKSALAAALTEGIEEDCDLLASWTGTDVNLPLAGKYSMTITVTMTSI